jgi:hypothetical protein
MLGRAIARSLDPEMFARDCGIPELDGWQYDLLTAKPRRVILNASRQVGKTATTALLCLECAMHERDALVILCAPSVRQSSELLRKIRDYYRILSESGGVPELLAEHAQRLEFQNNSRILALPGDGGGATVRGLSNARLVVFDEASRCSDELFGAIRPMLATNKRGQLILLSTPAGRRGFFYEVWHNNDDAWHRIKVAATDCPRISPEFLAEERRELGEQRFSEEYGLQFLDSGEQAFRTEIIDAIVSFDVRPLW